MGKNNHKGFDNFVQNLIRNKEDKAKKPKAVPQPDLTKPKQEQPVAPKSDADLLKMLSGGTEATQKENFSSQNRVKKAGLGYDNGALQQHQVSTLNAMQAMKDKAKPKFGYNRSQAPENVAKAALSKKAISKSEQDKLIDKRKEKLQRKKDKLRSKKIAEAEPEEASRPEEKKHFKKRNLKKTRSKLKNRRKDNRDPALLQKKFGSLMNV